MIKPYTFLIAIALLLLSCNKKENTLATLKTTDVINITDTTATVQGIITHNGNLTIVERGIVWSTNPNPTINDNAIIDNTNNNISVQIVGLSGASNYFVRTYAVNEVGVSYGNELVFTTTYTIVSNPGQPVVDIDGNTYETVELGNGQTWMAENLRVSSCSSGTAISNITDATSWANQTTPAYAHHDNNPNYDHSFGKLYNWYAAVSCDVCPSGWRVPTMDDFNELVDYLDPNATTAQMSNDAGSKMKVTGSQLWTGNNTYATNESGFSAIPGGTRFSNGSFNSVINHAALYWTTSEEANGVGVYGTFINYSSGSLQSKGYYKTAGLSIRCIKE